MTTGNRGDAVRELADVETIRALVHRYAHCVWQEDAAAAVDLFAEDGEMDTGRPTLSTTRPRPQPSGNQRRFSAAC